LCYIRRRTGGTSSWRALLPRRRACPLWQDQWVENHPIIRCPPPPGMITNSPSGVRNDTWPPFALSAISGGDRIYSTSCSSKVHLVPNNMERQTVTVSRQSWKGGVRARRLQSPMNHESAHCLSTHPQLVRLGRGTKSHLSWVCALAVRASRPKSSRVDWMRGRMAGRNGRPPSRSSWGTTLPAERLLEIRFTRKMSDHIIQFVPIR
jgi:hypothetical protein